VFSGRQLFKSHRLPIGIDFGERTTRLIQLAPKGDGFDVVAAAAFPTPDLEASNRNESLSQLIQEALSSHSFVGKRVVSSLPASAVQYKNIRLPQMPADELRSAVEWEAKDRLTQSDHSIQFFDAGDVRHGEETRREVILLAAENKLIEEHMAVLTQAGLTPTAIDAAPGALARCLSPQPIQEVSEQTQVLIDMGYASTKVLLVRNGRVVFFKLIPFGGRRLDETVAQHLSMPLVDAAEVRFRMAASEEAPDDKPLFGTTRKETVNRAIFEATRSTVEELSKEIGLCLRYFSVTFRGRRPDAACRRTCPVCLLSTQG